MIALKLALNAIETWDVERLPVIGLYRMTAQIRHRWKAMSVRVICPDCIRSPSAVEDIAVFHPMTGHPLPHDRPTNGIFVIEVKS